MQRILTGILAAAAVVGTATLPIAAAQSGRAAARIPNVTLTTQDGDAVQFYDDLINEKIVAINLIYTTCKYSCPLETARLAQLQKVLGDRMGRDVFFYSITIDPEHDTPAVLKAYAEKFHAGPGWLFLTGRQADIDLISRKMGLNAPIPKDDPDGHAPALLVGNEATGQWMRNSNLDNPKFLARTIGDWLTSWRGPRRQLKSYADAPQFTFVRGEYNFKNHCTACHTVGGGTLIGPDLLGVASRRDRAWLGRYILEPDKVLAEGDPIAAELLAKYNNVRMPNLALSRQEVDGIVEYLERRAAAQAVPPPAAAPSASAAAATMPPALIDAYLITQSALSANSLTGVHDASRTIAVQAGALGPRASAVARAASVLQQSEELRSARDAFGTVSEALITLANASGSGFGDGVNVAYCPMMRKHWLQRGTAIAIRTTAARCSNAGASPRRRRPRNTEIAAHAGRAGVWPVCSHRRNRRIQQPLSADTLDGAACASGSTELIAKSCGTVYRCTPSLKTRAQRIPFKSSFERKRPEGRYLSPARARRS
jgi:protein SCO1/2